MTQDAEKEKEKRILDLDLGSVFGDLELPTFKKEEEEENKSDSEDDGTGFRLPFKPYSGSTAVAKEIDASIFSHSPIVYSLQPICVQKPNYTDVLRKQSIPRSQIVQDPRLKKLISASPSSVTTPYSPTQQTFDLNSAPPACYNPNADLKPKPNRRDPRRRD